MNITIVGPRSVGKSTIGKLLAKELQLTYLEGDALVDEELKASGGLDATIKAGLTTQIFTQGYEVVKKSLEQQDVLFDLAGGAISSTLGEESGINENIRALIKTKSFVLGLLPYQDDRKSIDFLYARERERPHFKEMEETALVEKVNKDYLKLKPILQDVTKHIVYVEDKTPQTIVAEVKEILE